MSSRQRLDSAVAPQTPRRDPPRVLHGRGIGPAHRPRWWCHHDVRRHRQCRRAAVVPHPGCRIGPVRGRLRRDEPACVQRRRLLLLSGARTRPPGRSFRRLRRPGLVQRHSDRPLRAVRRRAWPTSPAPPSGSSWPGGCGRFVAAHRGRRPGCAAGRPERCRAGGAARPGVHRGAALRHRGVRQPGRPRYRRRRLQPGRAVRARRRRGVRVRRRGVHRVRVRRHLQRGVPRPAPDRRTGHLRRAGLHRHLLRHLGLGHDRSPSARPTCRPRPPRTVRAWSSARWPSTGAPRSPTSPTCCS